VGGAAGGGATGGGGLWGWGRVVRDRNLGVFFGGQVTSLVGSAMAALAVAFAVLEAGGGHREVGFVMAARIVPMVGLMMVAGVVADRFGARRVLVAAEVVQCLVQGGFAAVLLGADGRVPLWAFVALVAAWGVGEAFAIPARGALVPRVAAYGVRYEGKLKDANALAGLAQSIATVGGPALAGLAVAAAGSGVVLAIDAATYLVSVVALVALRLPPHAAPRERERGGFREGWAQFRSRTWLWVTTLHFTLFNTLVWAPYLVLGPVVAAREMGGARAWGMVMAVYGAGAVAGGLLLLGRATPRRPLVAATVATFGWALPSAALAAGLPLPALLAAALVAGAGQAVSGALYATANQRHVPAEALARITSLTAVGAFALGPLGLAAAGPAADLAGTRTVLGFGAVAQLLIGTAVLAVPAVRRLPARPEPERTRDPLQGAELAGGGDRA
ncbi:MFS transporter, partial [Thermocatellispora tengchongensis]|uniref:MFS transporter n=1 Tax=Thermocatellispora tengchongensis TaxID=1073253 RepID=UPI0031F0DF7D